MPTQSIGTIVTGLSFLTLQRGNAVLDALRPILKCGAAQICDAERHEMHANAEHWHDSSCNVPVNGGFIWISQVAVGLLN
nr:DUF1534 domain-containing protein [Pseudomonas congelans]